MVDRVMANSRYVCAKAGFFDALGPKHSQIYRIRGGSRLRSSYGPSSFMKFEKDELGRIAILPFYLYVMRTVSLTQARIDMSELDEDSDGFLQPHEMGSYIGGLIRNLAELRDM